MAADGCNIRRHLGPKQSDILLGLAPSLIKLATVPTDSPDITDCLSDPRHDYSGRHRKTLREDLRM